MLPSAEKIKTGNIPWELIKLAFWNLRTMYFTKPEPSMQLRVESNLEEMHRVFGKAHFTGAWELSYDLGEDLNMRRPEYEDDEYEWYQTHVRVYGRGDYCEIHVHYELCPTEYPQEHIAEVNYTREPGLQNTKDILTEAGIEWSEV
jgi:hypothetical protein